MEATSGTRRRSARGRMESWREHSTSSVGALLRTLFTDLFSRTLLRTLFTEFFLWTLYHRRQCEESTENSRLIWSELSYKSLHELSTKACNDGRRKANQNLDESSRYIRCELFARTLLTNSCYELFTTAREGDRRAASQTHSNSAHELILRTLYHGTRRRSARGKSDSLSWPCSAKLPCLSLRPSSMTSFFVITSTSPPNGLQDWVRGGEAGKKKRQRQTYRQGRTYREGAGGWEYDVEIEGKT